MGGSPERLRQAHTVAVGCDQLPESFHGKEGSTVRVRQRALEKRRKPALFRWPALADSPACDGYGALYGAFRFRARAPDVGSDAFAGTTVGPHPMRPDSRCPTAMSFAVVSSLYPYTRPNRTRRASMTATYTFDVFSSLDGSGAASGNWTGYWGKQGPEL